MTWTDEQIISLRALWFEGLSTAEIGRRIGVSKNAVVGKAHRLDLPARPSPLIGRRRYPRRVCTKGHPIRGANLRSDGRYGRCRKCDNALRKARRKAARGA